jgi:hypothetical protein
MYYLAGGWARSQCDGRSRPRAAAGCAWVAASQDVTPSDFVITRQAANPGPRSDMYDIDNVGMCAGKTSRDAGTAGARPSVTRERNWNDTPCRFQVWRRERDSNPRYPCGYSGFQDHRHRPLGHPSALKCRQILRVFIRTRRELRCVSPDV